MKPSRHRERRGNAGRGGHAVIEMALLSPWIFFLFVGVLDLGFYGYAAVSTQNAARAAALYASSSQATAADSVGACQKALGELRMMPNVGGTVISCLGPPVQVTAVDFSGACPDTGTTAPCTRVTVIYQTV